MKSIKEKLDTPELQALRVKAQNLATRRDELQQELEPLIKDVRAAYWKLWIEESEQLRQKTKEGSIQWDDLCWPTECSGSHELIAHLKCLVCDKVLGYAGYHRGYYRGSGWVSPLDDYMKPILHVHRVCMPIHIQQRLNDGF